MGATTETRADAGELRARAQRLAARPVDLTEARAEIDQLLRRSVGYDIGVLSTVDPASLLWTSCFVTGIEPDPARERALFELEFEGGDVNLYVDLAGADEPVGRLSAATDGELHRSTRYRRFLSGLGIGDELRAVLRSRGACWGTLALYRAEGAPPFSARDQAVVAEVAPVIADLFRLTLLRAALDAPHALDSPPGLVLVAPSGDIHATSAGAQQWLDAVDDRGRVPSVVRSVAAAATAGNGLAHAALPARDGRWVVFHASPVEGHGDGATTRRGEVAVIVEGARPVALSEVIAGAYGLTPREREITSLAAQGRTTKQMAAALGISPFTVQDHLKAVFAKTGVQSRGELVAVIYAQQYEPRTAAGISPGPYGWYLDGAAPAAG